MNEERERPPDEDEGLSEEELAQESGEELPERQAMSAIGDISVPLDPESAADALLGQDLPDDPDDAPD